MTRIRSLFPSRCRQRICGWRVRNTATRGLLRCAPAQAQPGQQQETTRKSEEIVAHEHDDRNEMQRGQPQPEGSKMPFAFLAAVSSFGFALTAYLTWSKLTSNEVVCPVGGCSSILSSPYAQIGPVPLPALGMLGYGSVALLSVLGSIKDVSTNVSEQLDTPLSAEQAILADQIGQIRCNAGTSVLAGTSIALALTLKTQFPGDFCAYCAASIVASLTLFFTSFFSAPEARRNWSFGGVCASTLAITLLYASYPDNVTARSYDIPFNAPEVTTASPAGAPELAARLRSSGAKMYGAFWCTHCFDQKQVFGQAAQSELPYVECYPDGYKGPGSISRSCTDADIQGFPTWVIRGQKVEGDWPLAALEEVLDGADPTTLAKKYPLP